MAGMNESYSMLPKMEPLDDYNGVPSSTRPKLNYSMEVEPHQLQLPLTNIHRYPNKKTDIGSRRDYVAWSKRETEALVRWLDSQDNFSAMKRNTSQVLPQLAEHLQSQIHGCTKTAKQCDHKIRNLKKCYKKVKEKLNRVSTAFVAAPVELQEEILDQFPYFKEFERIMREEHTIRSIPNALLKLAADGKCAKRKLEELDMEAKSATPVQPSPDVEFPDMSRFRSIRCKERDPANAIPTPESCSPPSIQIPKNSPYFSVPFSTSQSVSPESQNTCKRPKVCTAKNAFLNNPYQVMNECESNFSPTMEEVGKPPLSMDDMEAVLTKCPMDINMPLPENAPTLFNPVTYIHTPNSDSYDFPEENNHVSLLNILKDMAQKSDLTDADVTNFEEPKSQLAALTLAENVRSLLVKKESSNRQAMYLNHLQSQIQRHTARVELLYNNGQIERASSILDKIDEMEKKLHEALSRPAEQF